MRWKLQNYLDGKGITAYRLRKETGLSSNTIYPIVRGTARAVNLDTLHLIIRTLRSITNEEVTLDDFLEYIPE